MTIMPFALLPKQCDKCNRRFVFEPYEIYYIEVGIEHYPLKCYKCARCCRGEG